MQLMLRPATPWKQWFSLGEGKGKILMSLQFLMVYEGLLRMNLMEGVGLVKPDLVGDADVYLLMTLNDKAAKKKQKVKSKVIDGGGVNPVWKGGEILLLWCTEDAMFEGCVVDIYDDDVGRDDHMGSFTIDLFQYAALCTINGDGIKERMFPVRYKKKQKGEIKAQVDFYPPVELEVVVKEARSLYNPNMMGKSDPYLMLKCESQTFDFGEKSCRTKTVDGGGKTPNWGGEVLKVKLVDHAEMKIVCWDDDVGSDDKIGEADISLRDVFEWSVTERRKWDEQRAKREEAIVKEGHGDDVKVGKWIKLSRKGSKDAGEVLLEFNTNLIMGGNRNVGAKQMDYPQARPGIEPLCIFELKEKFAWEKSKGEDGSEYFYNVFSGETR